MVRCPACSTENPPDSRFCNGCGTRLTSSAPAAVTEERKVITALFCDLVGFTATSEGADPEDVDRMLTRYFQTARSQIELHGGVVEKFIGDAVVGVFGVPLAHGDDPERAVRAALRIADDAAGLQALKGAPLQLRIGINTGEALVRLDLAPGAGERFLAGDSVNTASRIQSVAPELGVAVGEETWRATSHLFEYDELPPAILKGKAEPVRVFHAIAPRSSLGVDVTRGQASLFVGRAAELATLVAALDRAVAASALEFATIVGEPGLGKSRLVSQLLAHVDTHPLLVTWRQGRCLPYGSGIAFWALGEIIKGQAGILESDPASVAIAKLDDVLPVGDERAWFRERLLPLLGIETGSSAGRDEQFTAWRRFLELLATQRPTVLVFEDLHWADEAMLAFLEELAVHSAGVPMLVIGTTRPELLERRPEFPNATDRTVRIMLEPLPPDAATHLLSDLLEGASIAPRLLEPILERAAGNPLFVEEFIRLLRDRDLLTTADGVTDLREGAGLPLPDTIHALLAARIDALPPSTKAILGDAAVIGKVFWAGAIAVMGERSPVEVRVALDGLTQRELVRPQPRSSMAGEDEFAFWLVLARVVAYAAMPRARRSSRHVAAARWIEIKAGDRIEDVAQILAHHHVTALELAVAVGDEQLAAEQRPSALRFLLLAGKRALGLDLTVAMRLLEQALALAPSGHPDRPMVLEPYGDGLNHDGRYRDAVAAYEEAIDLFRSSGQIRAAAGVIGKLAGSYEYMGDPRYPTLTREAVTLLEPLGPTPELATALRRLATHDVVSSRFEEALVGLDRALVVGESSSFPGEREALLFRATIAGWRGLVRASMGDLAGTDEVEQAIATMTAFGDGQTAMSFRINLTIVLANFVSPADLMGRMEDALAFGRAGGCGRISPGWRWASSRIGTSSGITIGWSATSGVSTESSRRRERRRSIWTCA
jgi:class 3 adenylate cyclase/tetratricopeptide (TPR) repeat protein